MRAPAPNLCHPWLLHALHAGVDRLAAGGRVGPADYPPRAELVDEEIAGLQLHGQSTRSGGGVEGSGFFSVGLAIGDAYRSEVVAREPPMRHTRGRVDSDELASVELIVTTAALLRAIGLLAIHFPEKFHVEAWRALTAESIQREAGASARPIVLARHRFDD